MSENVERRHRRFDQRLLLQTVISDKSNDSSSISNTHDQLAPSNRSCWIFKEFWKEKEIPVIYENLCQICGYGIYEAKGIFCEFCRFTINGNTKESNIYESICSECGEIFNEKSCEHCLKLNRKNNFNIEKSSGIFSSLLTTFRKVRSRDKQSKFDKFDIVHNVDGFENVFRTNDTFDLNEICQLKKNFSNNDHIYGKLRKNDNYITYKNITNEFKKNNINSKSESFLNEIFMRSSSSTCESRKISYDHVINWMTSLRNETSDYSSTPADESICINKSIPSKLFSCCDLIQMKGSLNGLTKADINLRSVFSNENKILTELVDNFKRNLMEKKRSKRKAVYYKIDQNIDIDDNNKLSEFSMIKNSNHNTLLHRSNRYGFCETTDSDFVSELLSAFDAYLNNNDTIKNEVNVIDNNSLNELVVNKTSDNNIIKNYSTKDSNIVIKNFDIKQLINNQLLSQSLNKIFITYDQCLKIFLNKLTKSNLIYLDLNNLIEMFVRLSAKFSPKTQKKITNNDIKKPESILSTTKDENIYQSIWKFHTGVNRQEGITLEGNDVSINDSSENPEDHCNWETDDDFMFSKNLMIHNMSDSDSKSQLTLTDTSYKSLYFENDLYQSVSIFYSVNEPKLRAIVYNYDPNQSYFTSQKTISNNTNIATSSILLSVSNQSYNINNSESSKHFTISDSVQAWKYLLLDVNYLDDEEDVYVCRDAITQFNQLESEIPHITTLQRFKSASIGNLLELPQDKKKSIGERFRNRLQLSVLKLNNRQPKDKKSRQFFKRSDSSSLYLDDNIKLKNPIFGISLEKVDKDTWDYNVPRFVADCISLIELKENIQSDGIYRASGNKVAIDEVKKKLNENYFYDPRILNSQDVHTITGLLKLFFRELKSPLVPEDLYRRIPSNLNDKSSLSVIKDIMNKIPNPAKGTLKFVLKHLTVVAHHSDFNRMPASNLAIIWGPCILYSSSMGPFDIAKINTLTKILIENYDTIFGDNERLVN